MMEKASLCQMWECAMYADDLLTAIRKRPFEPFRIQVSDGTVYDIRHPDLVMVGLGAVILGVPPPGVDKPVYERAETVSLQHIVKLLPLAVQTTGKGNGKAT
jgi:hypothetical protein